MAGGRRFTLLLLLGLYCAHAMPQQEEEGGGGDDGMGEEDAANENEVEIATPYGLMKGLKVEVEEGDESSVHHYRFLGVPYAEPPVGDLRFREPIAIQPWRGVMNATEFGNKCPQINFLAGDDADAEPMVGDEDCLFLNVFTPRLPVPREGKVVPPKSSLLPVMIYVHGGGFVFGDGDLDPSPLLKKDVVVVSINYRLGALGFLALDNHLAAGNQGLKDQLEAFKWVSNNIVAFGGDPSKVTIFGESAGGMSVHYHMLSPYGEGLYKGVIAMSGTALLSANELHRRDTESDSAKLVNELGCDSYDAHSMVSCLQGKNVSELFEIISAPAGDGEGDLINGEFGNYRFAPIIDGDFLPEHPIEILKSGRQKDLPLITGVTADEGGFFVGTIYDKFEEAEANFTEYGPKWFFRTRHNDEATKEDKVKAEVIRRFYLNGHEFSAEFSLDMIDMMGDAYFNFPAYKSLELHSKTQQSPVFMYMVTHAPSHSFGEIFFAKTGGDKADLGVNHADDLFFLFDFEGPLAEAFPDAISTEEDKATREKMTTLWANFAEHHDPTPYTDGELVAWHPFTEEEDNFLEIQEEPAATKDFHKTRMFLWEKLVWEDLEELVDQSASSTGDGPTSVQPPPQPRTLPGIIPHHHQHLQQQQQPAGTNRLPGNGIAFGARPTFTNGNFFNTPYFN